MAELCPISQNVEEIAKKLRISDSDSGDPTSRLPDHVLHSILSYLKSEQLFHARLVSKNWHSNTPSYFPLEFDESIFFEKTPTTPAAVIQESHNKFLEWIRSSLETSQPELIKAEKRVIRVQFKHHENINDIMKLINGIDFHEGICNEFLISRRDGNCCADTRNKCWRHFLKDFMVREAVTNEKEELKKFSFVFTWQL